MSPQFLIPETTVREAGTVPVSGLGEQPCGMLTLTLGLTRIIEQESIDLSIWASTDGTDWGTAPVASFSQKFYCGTYQVLLDLSERPDVRFLRAKWQVNRWGKGDSKPLFGLYLFAEQLQPRVATAGGSY